MARDHTRSGIAGNDRGGPEMPKNHPDFAQFGWLPSPWGWGVSGSVSMSSSSAYRTNAEDCLRMARTAPDERDRPFWLTLALSWLRLAEHSARARAEIDPEKLVAGGVD